jgi:hypothetical protein
MKYITADPRTPVSMVRFSSGAPVARVVAFGLFTVVTIFALGAGAGCGSAFTEDYFDASVTDDAATTSDRDGASNAPPGDRPDAHLLPVPAGDAGPREDAATADASVPDSGRPTPTPDAAPPPPDAGTVDTLRCGDAVLKLACNTSLETCCATTVPGGGFGYSCLPAGIPCTGLIIGCTAEADCRNGTTCCDVVTGGTEKIACMPAAACARGTLLCNPTPGAAPCPAGLRCMPYGGFVPYYACRP